MNDTPSERLLACFRGVFPHADDAALRQATVENTPEWDSVAMVTLVALVEEEFGTVLPIDEVPEMTSFEKFLQRTRA